MALQVKDPGIPNDPMTLIIGTPGPHARYLRFGEHTYHEAMKSLTQEVCTALKDVTQAEVRDLPTRHRVIRKYRFSIGKTQRGGCRCHY